MRLSIRKYGRLRIIMKLSYIILGCLLFVSCKSSKLKFALSFAGDNRNQLEQVLEHYSQNDRDSLKLKAAIFLIENMPGHFSYDEDERIDAFYEKAEQIIDAGGGHVKIKKKLEELSTSLGDIEYVQDIHIITADYLIKNIDMAFEAWELPTARHLNFDEFCEFLLPYKVADRQKLDDWRDFFKDKYWGEKEDILENDEYDNCVATIATATNTAFAVDRRLNLVYDYNGYVLRTKDLLNKLPFGTCHEYSILAVSTLRSHGIPSVLDGIPRWKLNPVGHDWFTVKNNNGVELPTVNIFARPPGNPLAPWEFGPKVFRDTYAPSEKHLEYLQKAKYRLPFLNAFKKDVTAKYFAVSDVVIPVKTKGLDDKKYAYIAYFNNTSWDAVYFGKIKNGKATFEDMGRNIVYIVLGYKESKLVPISEPFYLKSNGSISYFDVDKNNLEEVELYRKYPKRKDAATYEKLMIGGQVHASNDRDFKEYDVMLTIDDIYMKMPHPVDTTKEYRYWRYVGPENSKSMISEFQFFLPESGDRIKGKVITSEENITNFIRSNLAKAFDNNWLTFYFGVTADPWVGYDFKNPITIGKVLCVARSDDNSIHLGDKYELSYWDAGQWVSLGKQTAKENVLYFENVPKGALLWLRDHTQGVQEHIFTYENGKQVWY